ncbi:MAG: penicillin-binding protein 2 [Alphaproteobacteria bacterium]|nr:penicillin-binding protein 2 [Alphaproteobacteria bacterium]
MYNEFGQNFYSLAYRGIKTAKRRTLFAISVFVFLFAVIIVRLAHIMIINGKDQSTRNYFPPTIISRADIVDRNGIVIATSLPTVSLFAYPHEILDINEAVDKIASVFNEINKKELKKKIESSKKFLWIKRNLSPLQEQAVLNLGIPGLHFLKTERRVYPDKNLLSHVIGGTDVDNIGIAGIEKVFDDTLRESTNPLALSMDVKIQYAVHDELQKSINEFHAIGGAAVVMNIATGEIISLVSLPDFDPNKKSDPKDKSRFNMVTSSAIEPGSSAKIFNTAMALETGKITPFTQFDARFPLKIGRFTIHDFKGKATFLSVEEILKYSSNIGSGRIAMAVGANQQKAFFKKIGMLDSVSCELIETQRPLFPHQWSEASAITIAFGHGIAVSPLHLITIFSGIMNDGILNDPTLLKHENRAPGKQIVSQKTSKLLKALIRLNVTEGTNKFAEVKGYCVGGKSGTAEKQKGGRYLKHSNYCGFIGAFPMTSPKYAVYVVLDEPKASAKTYGYATAGWNAAPTAGRIIKRIGPMLNVTVQNDSEPDWHDVLRKESGKI